MTEQPLVRLITAIHATPPRVVIEFAGAGSQALTWLHSVGGSSRTILEATDHYSALSLCETVGFQPEKFTSTRVARALATHAYLRACHLAEPGAPVAGIGCTATIATDRPKRGQHRCRLVICDERGVATYKLILTKGLRTRQEEEALISRLILRAVARVCQVNEEPPLDLAETDEWAEYYEAVDLPARLVGGEIEGILISPEGFLIPGQTWPHIALLSGAFNPLHDGHRHLARVAAEILQQPVYFELPLINADKAPIDLAEARRRAAQFRGFAPVILTRTPLFDQKAALFPHSVFILGIDTVIRLVQPRFYNDDRVEMLASLRTVRRAGCRFLVAGRVQDHHFLTLSELELPEGYRDLFEQIPEDRFRVDISSTTIRDN